MKKYYLLTSLLILSFAALAQDLTSYVNPFVGTGAHGHTFPGATRPFAMVQLSPDTHLLGWDASSGYHASDSTIYAFSHTHLSGTGIGDLGDIALLPYSSCDEVKPVATFKKSSEEASPGYYKVYLDNFDVEVELTTTERVGLHKYSYKDASNRRVMLDLGHILQANWGHRVVDNSYTFVNDSTIQGTHHTSGWAAKHLVSYQIQFSEAPTSTTRYIDQKKQNLIKSESTESDLKFHFKFKDSNKPLYVKVAISMVSPEGAARNMAAELKDFDFERVRNKSNEIWNDALSSIEIKSGEDDVMRNFYTALYHTMIAPCRYQDVDGSYMGMDKKIYKSSKPFYTIFSMWDTFRTLHPLMTIIEPELSVTWGDNLVEAYEHAGILPRWPLASNYTGCMVGYPAVSILADMVSKGLVSSDRLSLWLDASTQSSIYRPDLIETMLPREQRHISEQLYFKDKYGFIPSDSTSKSVSWGVECAYYDWCVAQTAKAAGRNDIAKEYEEKSKIYLRYLDPQTKLMRGVNADGSFVTPFDPYHASHNEGDYTEGTAFQWSFLTIHDMDNYIDKMGGAKKFEVALDTLFTTSSLVGGQEASGDITGLIGQYAHGNEPSHHMAYLYNWTSSPKKGQEYLDFIMREFYTQEDDGIIGNEDCGQMSAWYVLSALGVYQLCPGDPIYTLGRPMVDRAQVEVSGGKFTVIAHNNSPQNKYVKEARLNGKKLKDPFISHQDIIQGSTLEFFMSDK